MPSAANPRRGWVGDALDGQGRRLGSLLWLLSREKQTEQTRLRAACQRVVHLGLAGGRHQHARAEGSPQIGGGDALAAGAEIVFPWTVSNAFGSGSSTRPTMMILIRPSGSKQGCKIDCHRLMCRTCSGNSQYSHSRIRR